MSDIMVRLWVLALLLAPASVLAAQTTLAIPDQGWQLSFDAPALSNAHESRHPDQYKYSGSAGRFALSLFVETPGCDGSGTHQAFLDCLWPNASRNPLIVRDSIRQACGEKYCKVTYDVEAPLQGRLVRQRNVNFLIAYKGKWTDLHVSVIDPGAGDLKLLEKFERSLTYR